MSEQDAAAAEPDTSLRRIRLNALVLAAGAAVHGGIPPIHIAMGGLAGVYLLGPDKSLATLPITTFLVGSAVGAIPAAQLMRRVGRQAGFMLGTVFAMIGALLAGLMIMQGSFVGFCLVVMISGFAQSFVQQYRFAAADVGPPDVRARAISWVLAGGVVAAVIGPQTAIHTRDLLAPIPFAGAYFAMAGLALVTLLILTRLGGAARNPPPPTPHGGRPFAEIAMQPRFVVAVLCAVGAYALMSLVMTAAPLAMVGHDHSHDHATLGIQWHVIAMFAPSFVTGALIARFGYDLITGAGFLLLALTAVVALTGYELLNFWTALIVLGVGWNFGFIGATSMLMSTHRPEERATVQGANDLVVFGMVALASLLSGRLLATVGWEWINIMVFPAVAVCLAAIAAVALFERRTVGS